MSKYTVEPLLAVGYEGFFGFLTTLIGMFALHVTIGRTPEGKGGPFDFWSGWTQITSVPAIWWSSLVIALSIALFNFFGLSVTRSVSATARSTIGECASGNMCAPETLIRLCDPQIPAARSASG